MTTREDRLDALLDALDQPPQAPPRDQDAAGLTLAGLAAPRPDDRDLAPLLAAARELADVAQARPDPGFAARLGERLLARAAVLREDPATQPTARVVAFPSRADGAEQGARRVSPAQGYNAGEHDNGGQIAAIRGLPRQRTRQRGILRPALIAAAMLVLLGGGALTAALAASAVPGSPLFGLRQIEQHAGQSFMNAGGRAQSHMQAARQWLDSLAGAASGQPGFGSYGATLEALLSEDAAAAQAIQQVPPGATRDTLTGDLAALRTDERVTLLAVLPQVAWPDRIATTAALAPLGAAVPAITAATITAGHGLWQVTLTGTGFELGAVLLIDDRPLGTVLSVNSTVLIAQAPSGLLKDGGATLGIGNPDGTAAITTAIQQVPAPTSTPTNPGSGGNGGNGNGGHGHGNPHDAPTPGA